MTRRTLLRLSLVLAACGVRLPSALALRLLDKTSLGGIRPTSEADIPAIEEVWNSCSAPSLTADAKQLVELTQPCVLLGRIDRAEAGRVYERVGRHGFAFERNGRVVGFVLLHDLSSFKSEDGLVPINVVLVNPAALGGDTVRAYKVLTRMMMQRLQQAGFAGWYADTPVRLSHLPGYRRALGELGVTEHQSGRTWDEESGHFNPGPWRYSARFADSLSPLMQEEAEDDAAAIS